MKNLSIKIAPMTRVHVPACSEIVASSEPWKTLGEGVDFLPSIKRNMLSLRSSEGQWPAS